MSSVPFRQTEWELTPEAFDRLLLWLNPDRERAGRKYEEIRRKLITILSSRGCTCPEDLTDEAMNRVTRKVPEIIDNYVGDPALYFYGVAHKVHLEWVRRNGRAGRGRPESDCPCPAQAGSSSGLAHSNPQYCVMDSNRCSTARNSTGLTM